MNNLVTNKKTNKTHHQLYSKITSALKTYRKKINTHEQLIILEELANFELGRHILLTGGANGVWTDYMISPSKRALESNLSLIEKFLLFHSPVVCAQRELFIFSRKLAQSLLSDHMCFASIPCGVMRDLLTLDFSSVENVSLFGIDIDPLSLDEAQKLALQQGIQNVTFLKEDAWNLEFEDQFDFINSIGLNVYESDKTKVLELYNRLYRSLKPGGILFTGILTWPPYIDESKSEWAIKKISKFDLYLEKLIHKEILDIKWLNFRRLKEAIPEFKKAGFSHVEIQQDSCCIFPAVIARK